VIGVVLDAVSWLLLIAGSFFVITGGIGLMSLPDVYSRMHAAGMTDTLGAGLFIAGMAVQAGFTLVTVKLLIVLVFILFTGPTATHALANAVWAGGVRPKRRDGTVCETIDRSGGPSKS
jgi:multicomponent Na+:H+ antiporter subunit G